MGSRLKTYRKEARAALEELPETDLRVARDFLTFLRLKRDAAPTLEILANPRMMREFRAGRRALEAGRARLIPWTNVRRDV